MCLNDKGSDYQQINIVFVSILGLNDSALLYETIIKLKRQPKTIYIIVVCDPDRPEISEQSLMSAACWKDSESVFFVLQKNLNQTEEEEGLKVALLRALGIE